MTRGRKKDPQAVRDGRDPATEIARVEAVVPAPDDTAQKPAYVELNPNVSLMWDQLVGDGSAYREQDVPLLTQWVFWTAMACQLMDRMTDPGGEIVTLADEVRGGQSYEVDTPLIKQLKTATDQSLKLAEHFGGTPMARARLGLTKAATASIGEDIRAKIIAAMREGGE